MSGASRGYRRLRKLAKVSVAPAAMLTVVGAIAAALQTQSTQQQNSPPDTTVVTPERVELGRAIFHGQGTCFACHGQKLEGSQIAPTLMPHEWRDAKNGEFAAIYYVATHGVKSTLMVAYPGGISPEQALAVASYVWSVSTGKAKP